MHRPRRQTMKLMLALALALFLTAGSESRAAAPGEQAAHALGLQLRPLFLRADALGRRLLRGGASLAAAATRAFRKIVGRQLVTTPGEGVTYYGKVFVGRTGRGLA